MCVHTCIFVCVYTRVCLCACMCECMYVCVCVGQETILGFYSPEMLALHFETDSLTCLEMISRQGCPLGAKVATATASLRAEASLRFKTHKCLGDILGPASPSECLNSSLHCQLTVILSIPRGTADPRLGLPPSLQMHVALVHCCFPSPVTKQSGLAV